MRVVCPQDVKKMLLKQARTTHWRKWAAKHESEELKEGVGSLLGVTRKWSAGGWSVVQLDHDEEMGPKHGIHGTLEADLGVQRTIKRAELTAFLCFLIPQWFTLITKGSSMGCGKEK